MENSNNNITNYVLDRVEGEYAIMLDTKSREYDVLIEELPHGAVEGDVFFISEGVFRFNEEATQIKREKIKKIKESIVKKS